LNDVFCSSFISYLTKQDLLDDEKLVRYISTHHSFFSVIDAILYYTGNPNAMSIEEKLVVPSVMQSEILEAFHDLIFSGHLGYRKTLYKIISRFFWNNMHS